MHPSSFDQRASAPTQRIPYPTPSPIQAPTPESEYGETNEQPYPPQDRRISYVLQNVGEITNRGWELKSDLNLAYLTLSGTFSTVDSRVKQVAAGYIGDLRVGDRMLEVPARTGSVSAARMGGGWA